jgi:DNA mismatch repair ATPase MutS
MPALDNHSLMFCRKRVTFLYKLTHGISPKSYGIHVAHMAGIPSCVIEQASKFASQPLSTTSSTVNDMQVRQISKLIQNHHLNAPSAA